MTRARGMFCGELPRKAGRGVLNVGEQSTLLAAQLAVEVQAERFVDAQTETTARAPRRLPGESFKRKAAAAA